MPGIELKGILIRTDKLILLKACTNKYPLFSIINRNDTIISIIKTNLIKCV